MEKPHAYSVLAVDDNLLNLKLIEKSLSKEGYRVLCEDNGPDARKTAEKEVPDLVLLDIEMPGENGFEVLEKLKDNSKTSHIPVIFLTGISEVNAKLKGFDLGAVDYITKPFHPLEVLARVRIHLQLSIATNSMIESQADKLRQVSVAQKSLLPAPGDNPEAFFSVYYKALEEAGGDFYEILNISDHITGYFVADFSGHNIETAYLTAAIKALLAQNCTPVFLPSKSITMINDVLVQILPADKYLTGCYMHINRMTSKLTIINAGHPPVVCIPAEGEPYLIKSEGDVLGMFTDAHFGTVNMDVAKGDRFVLYSDGLVESGRDGIAWDKGAETILPLYKKIAGTSYDQIPSKIVEEVFGRDNPPDDDIVVLCTQI